MNDALERRPRLAYPFTVLTGPNLVRIVAGEDFRYTLTAPGIELWLPPLLAKFMGKESLATLVTALTTEQQAGAQQIVTQLYGERVLVDGTALDSHFPQKYRVKIEGSGRLCDSLKAHFASATTTEVRVLVVLCQDCLDYEHAIQVSQRCRVENRPLLWASYGALSRAYVSPLFLPGAGPCFGCLYRSFQRLSPAPEIYDVLREHARQQKPLEPVDFPENSLLMLEGLVRWKIDQAELEDPSPGLYRLHVFERESFEVTTHRVFADPFCPECGEAQS
jgi:bacteriocin biosynthesis cyclodehydratase domain-containing protein